MLRFTTLLLLVPALAYALECGISPVDQSRIVGGVDAREHEFPWQVSWRYLNKTTGVHRHICGASIILNDWLVTAAHCVDLNQDNTADPSLFLAGLGMHLQNTENSFQKVIAVEKIIINPGWDSKVLANDIALIKLSQSVDFNENLNAICVGQPGDSVEGRNALISGWGLTVDKGTEIPNVLQKAVVPVVKQSSCKSIYSIIVPIRDTMVCAGYKPGVCNGDSGGPLVYTKDNPQKFYLLGATSFGAGGCGSTIFPGVFSRVPLFRGWIEEVTGQSLP